MKMSPSAPPTDAPFAELGAPLPTPAPPGRLLLTRGLVALAVGVLGCAQKGSDPADSVQPELNANAPTPEPAPQKQPEPRPRANAAADAPPPSPFLVAPGGVVAAPEPTPTPAEPPRLVPTSTRVNPVVVNTIAVPPPPPPHPPAPPPHPWNNRAPHPWRGNDDLAPHPPPPHPRETGF